MFGSMLFKRSIKNNRIKNGMEAFHAPHSTARNYPGTVYGVWAEPGSTIEWYKTLLPHNGRFAITGYKITQPMKKKPIISF